MARTGIGRGDFYYVPHAKMVVIEVPGYGNHGNSVSSGDPSVTPLVVFSTLVAVCGSFITGCASGYSSPAESGIMEDLGLSMAAELRYKDVLRALLESMKNSGQFSQFLVQWILCGTSDIIIANLI